MKRFLMSLIVVLLTLLTNWQGKEVSCPLEQPQQPSASVVTPQHPRHHEATLTDASSLYRICTTRPQRVIPTHGSNPQRSAGSCCSARRHIVKPLHYLHDSRRRLETAPYCLSASCKYYVIALRHILR